MRTKLLSLLSVLFLSVLSFGQVQYGGTVQLGGTNLDAFGRVRVSNPETIFAVQSQYNTNPLQMESNAFGTGVVPTWSSSTRMVQLQCTAGTGKSFTQSYAYLPYEPGKSQLIKLTGVAGAGVAGATVDYMYGDSLNAIIIRQNGVTDWRVILRTSVSGSIVENTVARSAWNDKLDGTGKSGFNISLDSNAIFFIQLQFLGMGQITCGVDYNGLLVPFYSFNNAFHLATPYMQSATLPVGMVVTSTSTATTKTAYFKCAAVESEGGVSDFDAFQFSTPEATETAGNDTRVHILSIRPKTTFGGVPNREYFTLTGISLMVTGANNVYWELCIGATTAASTWADVNANSAFEYTSVRGSFTNLTNGIVIASGYVTAPNNGSSIANIPMDAILSQKYPITLNRAGAVRDMGTLTLLVKGIGNTSATRAAFLFKESR